MPKDVERYNQVVSLVENCVEDILQSFDMYLSEDCKFDDGDLFQDLSLRLSYFSLEVLSMFSHNH